MRCYKLVLIILMSSILLACAASDTLSMLLRKKHHDTSKHALLSHYMWTSKPTILWRMDIGDRSSIYKNISQWSNGKMKIAVDNERKVSSYEKSTGHLLWQVRLNTPIISGVGGGDNGLILVGSTVGEVLALDETNGELLWRNSLSGEILTPLKGSHDIVGAQSSNGQLTGLSANNGAILWSYRCSVPSLSLRGTSAAVMVDNKVIASYANGKLIALSIIDGEIIWDKEISIPDGETVLERIVDIDVTPVIRDGRVYVVSSNGNVIVTDLDNGNRLWMREYPSHVGLDAVVHDAVYISDTNDHIWALDDDAGDLIWQYSDLLGRKITAPIVIEDNILVGDLEGHVHVMSRENSGPVFRLQVSNNAIINRPIIIGDVVYVISFNGTLTALRM